MVSSRDRILTALAGGVPDRTPLATSWGPVEARLLGMTVDEMIQRFEIDATMLFLQGDPHYERFQHYLEEIATDARVGEAETLRVYAEWDYRPPGVRSRSSPEHNRLEGAISAADVSAALPRVNWTQAAQALASEVECYHATGVAVCVTLPHLGGLWFEELQRLRGYEQSLLDLIENRDLTAYLIDQMTAMHAEAAAWVARAGADILWLDDDIGMPDRMMISPDTWRCFFKPALRDVIAAGRAVRQEIAVCYHSDGYFEPIIPDLIEIGVDAINPVQPDVFDRGDLKRKYSSQIALWGGVGTQRLWAWGSPQDVRAETLRAMAELGPGGYVAAPAYDIEPDVPPGNLVAFFNAVRTGW